MARKKAQAGPAGKGRPATDKKARRHQSEKEIFALDIGTRTVIGVVGERLEGDAFRVLDHEQMEHPGRAMMDGQVEDIAQVGRLIKEVKERLEGRLGIRLSRVSIAAAGRMLRTVQVRATRQLPGPHSLADRDMVIGLEGEAIELAQEQAKAQAQDGGREGNYYCVGYSIVEYCMDGQPVSQLVGHTCSEISVELIAAFLPYSVVEGLYAAVDMNELEVMSLTLEPIAAINVLIPRELRLLNLALVDIGAGTSDIAVCRDGRINAYDMATIAGDELTEAIIRAYLVDFPTAETMKRGLSRGWIPSPTKTSWASSRPSAQRTWPKPSKAPRPSWPRPWRKKYWIATAGRLPPCSSLAAAARWPAFPKPWRSTWAYRRPMWP